MSVRSASRGSPAASSIRLALRTSSIVATRRASFVRWVLTLFRQAALEFRAEAIRNFLDAVHHAVPGAAKSGILESHIDSSRQQPSCRTDRWQGFSGQNHADEYLAQWGCAIINFGCID